MKLREVSPADAVTNAGLQGLEEGCALLPFLEFYQVGGDQDRLETEQDAAGGATIFRALNAENTPTTHTPTYDTIAKYIVSRTVSVDDVVEQRGEDPATVLIRRTIKEFRRVGYHLMNAIINGDNGVDSNSIDGFVNQVDSGKVLTGDYGGVAVPVGGDNVLGLQQIAAERLLQQFRHVRAFTGDKRVIAVMNSTMRARWVSVLKRLEYYQQIQELGQTFDSMMGDFLIVSAGMNYDGLTEFLPFSESTYKANSTSIWFFAPGERVGLTCPTSAGLVGKYNAGTNNFGYNTLNLDFGMGLQDVAGLVRGTGWTLE